MVEMLAYEAVHAGVDVEVYGELEGGVGRDGESGVDVSCGVEAGVHAVAGGGEGEAIEVLGGEVGGELLLLGGGEGEGVGVLCCGGRGEERGDVEVGGELIGGSGEGGFDEGGPAGGVEGVAEVEADEFAGAGPGFSGEPAAGEGAVAVGAVAHEMGLRAGVCDVEVSVE